MIINSATPKATILTNGPIVQSKTFGNQNYQSTVNDELNPILKSNFQRPLSPSMEKYSSHAQPNPPPSTRPGIEQYRKSAYTNLININNNLSCMLKDSCAEIDDLCHKVRLCLLDANTIKTNTIELNSSKTLDIAENVEKKSQNTCLEISEAELIEESIIDDETLLESMETDTLISQKESVTTQPVTSKENSPNRETSSIRLMPNLTPFFTIVNTKYSERSINCEVSIPTQISSGEHFQNAINNLEQIDDYDQFLKNMTDDIHREIETFYNNFSKNEKLNNEEQRNKINEENDTDKPTNNSNNEPDTNQQRRRKTVYENELKRYQELGKYEKETLEGSDNDMEQLDPIRRDAMCLDVYRKRAHTDIHKRLVEQLEANDSFIFFQKLMSRNNSSTTARRNCNTATGRRNHNTVPTAGGIKKEKYTGIKYRHVKVLLPPQKQQTGEKKAQYLKRQYQNSLWFKQLNGGGAALSKKNKKEPKKRNKKLTKSDHDNKITELSTLSAPRAYRQHANGNSCRIIVTNEQPLTESEKCKLRGQYLLRITDSSKRLDHIDILDDITLNDILPITSEYPRRDNIMIPPTHSANNITHSYLYQLTYGKNMEIQNAWHQFFQPNMNCSQNNCRICGKNSFTKSKPTESNNLVARKLSKYIFASDDIRERSFTVMPVHVYYDKFPMNNQRNCQQLQFQPKATLPLLPMKETKEPIKKVEWSMDPNRKFKATKKVYDPMLKRIETEMKMSSARNGGKDNSTTINSRSSRAKSLSPTHFAAYSTDSSDTSSTPVATIESSSGEDGRCPKFQNTYYYTQLSKFKPTSLNINPIVPPLKNLKSTQTKQDTSTKPEQMTNNNNNNNMGTKLRKKNDKQLNTSANKYSKIHEPKLMSFLSKPSLPAVTTSKVGINQAKKTINVSGTSSSLAATIKRNLKPPAQKVLTKINSLKQKNDRVQSNIQKAINTIEKKMVHIISEPENSVSFETFNEMEKQINEVLTMMKTPEVKTRPSSPLPINKLDSKSFLDEYNKEVKKMSTELFERLDRILESRTSFTTLNSTNQSPGHTKLPLMEDKKDEFKEDNNKKEDIKLDAIDKKSPKSSKIVKDKTLEISPKKSIKTSKIASTSTKTPVPPAIIQTKATIDEVKMHKKRSPTTPPPQSTLPIQSKKTDQGSGGDQVIKININDNQGKDKQDKAQLDLESERKFPVKSVPREINFPYETSLNYQQPIVIDTDSSQISIIEPSNNTNSTIYFTPQGSAGLKRLHSQLENPKTGNGIDSNIEQDKCIEQVKQKVEMDDTENGNREINDTDEDEEVRKYYENINRIIKKAERVYSQLEKFENEAIMSDDADSLTNKSPIIKENEDDFAIEDVDVSKEMELPINSPNDQLHNILNFLENLHDFDAEPKVSEFYICREYSTAQIMYSPKTYSYSCLELIPIEHALKKRSGCLKTSQISQLPAGPTNVKNKQKVSFSLTKEDKETQATPCPLHRINTQNDEAINTETFDRQIEGNLNAKYADEIYQDTYETPKTDNNVNDSSDCNYDRNAFNVNSCYHAEMSLESPLLPPLLPSTITNEPWEIQTAEQEDLMEIPQNERNANGIKVFYDDYTTDSINVTLNGCYNDDSIEKLNKNNPQMKWKKQNYLHKLTHTNCKSLLAEIIEAKQLFKPLKNLHNFIDTKWFHVNDEPIEMEELWNRNSLKQIPIKRQITNATKVQNILEMTAETKEGLLKGFYVFVFLVMFTALNLEYKCIL